MHTQYISHREYQGFTLIELLIVVVIIGLLATIALPSYDEYIKRSRRVEARNVLLQGAQWMERASTATGSYPLTASFPSELTKVNGDYYTITLASTDGSTYTLTAKPQSAQASDKCGSYIIDQTGSRSLSGNTSTETVTSCWNK